MSDVDTGRFPDGTFTPAPGAAAGPALLKKQTRMETVLILRHGEQALLSLIIPLGMLVGLSLVPILDLEDPVQRVLPLTLAVAAMSAGFTGQAIALGFDRKYGALKRIGASGLPKWGIISGKVGAVAIVVTIQFALILATAVALGFRADFIHVLLAYLFTMLGAASFSTMGLLMGGTLKGEVILALANIVWFALMGVAALVAVGPAMAPALETALTFIPSVALTQGLISLLDGPGVGLLFPILVLLGWGFLCGAAAVRLFRFEAPRS